MTTETVKKKARWCWRKDLAEFRGLTDRERTGFLLVLEWFENRVFSVPGGGISQAMPQAGITAGLWPFRKCPRETRSTLPVFSPWMAGRLCYGEEIRPGFLYWGVTIRSLETSSEAVGWFFGFIRQNYAGFVSLRI